MNHYDNNNRNYWGNSFSSITSFIIFPLFGCRLASKFGWMQQKLRVIGFVPKGFCNFLQLELTYKVENILNNWHNWSYWTYWLICRSLSLKLSTLSVGLKYWFSFLKNRLYVHEWRMVYWNLKWKWNCFWNKRKYN